MAEPSIFDQVREKVSLADFAGRYVKLARSGREMRGPCPVCKAGVKSDSPPFAIKAGGEKWRCYAGCDGGGDVVDLYRGIHGGDALDAARALLGGDYRPPAEPLRRAAPEAAEIDERKLKRASEMWEGAKTFAGSLGETYLLGRGIAPEVVAAAAPRLRFHPAARHSWDEDRGTWLRAPAMLAQAETPAGATGGVHATFLLRDGSGRDKALGKKMLGPHMLDGLPGGAWLIGPEGEGSLAVCEGIETTLSLVTLQWRRTGRMMRACAALSLGRLQGGILKDEQGCIDAFDPQPNPAMPAFTWPNPPHAPWSEVLIGVDRDMSPWKVARARGPVNRRTGERRIMPVTFEAEARARLCARLAVHWWRRAGSNARAVAPRPGADFNNELGLRPSSERAA